MTEEMLRRDVKEDIGSKHTTTDTLMGSKHDTTHDKVSDAKASMLTDIGSKHATTQSKIATVSTAVGVQAGYIKQYLVHGAAPITGDPTVFTESASTLHNQGAAWAVMLSKMIDSPEAIESKVIDSVFVDLGWKHKADNEGVATAFMTKWVASHMAAGDIITGAPAITDSVMAPSSAFATVHRSGAIKLAGMNKLPLKIALMGKASAGATSHLEASVLSDCVVELKYTI